jgi:ribosomal protein S18 acetylase RimI-like enzyme
LKDNSNHNTLTQQADNLYHLTVKKFKAVIEQASIKDAEEILKLQKLAYRSEAEIYNDFSIAPLKQTLKEIRSDFNRQLFLKATADGTIIGSVRAYPENETCYIGRLIVHPDFQNQGLGTLLMQAIEEQFEQAKKYQLFTGHRSERNLHLYQKLGYQPFKSESPGENPTIVYLEKPNKRVLKLGCCGDDCNYCPRYLATKSGDKELLQAVADTWQTIGWRQPGEDLDTFACHGCGTLDNCGLGIRQCVLDKGLNNCGECPGYPCEKLTAIFMNNEKTDWMYRKIMSMDDYPLFRKAFFSKKDRLDKIHREFFR